MALTTCNVLCTVHDDAGIPVQGATVSAKLNQFEVYNGYVVPSLVEGTTDANGQAMLALWPNQLGSTESMYVVKISAPNGKRLTVNAVVPNVSSTELHLIAELPPYDGKTDGQLILDAAVAAGVTAVAKAAEAASSATSATSSATTASTAATTAAGAATTATTKAGEAATSATNAAASLAQIGNSLTAAQTAATAAATSATNAAGSATTASTAATTAATSASNAATSATTATNKATEAETSATSAAGSATTATNQATIATTKASEALTSANNAANSANAAAQSAIDAADASRLTIGTVSTVAVGGVATATITGEPGSQVLNFGLVTGPKGEIGPSTVFTEATPPENPQDGWKWMDPESGVEYTWFDDGNSSQWVEAGGVGLKGDKGDPGTTTWAGIADKPATFPPSAHAHVIGDVTDLQTALDGKLDRTFVDGALAYAATVNLDMEALAGLYRTLTLTGNVAFTTSNRAVGRAVVIRLLSGASARTLGFPAGWVFLGAVPTTLAANKTAVLSVTCFGTADTDAVVAYAVQP